MTDETGLHGREEQGKLNKYGDAEKDFGGSGGRTIRNSAHGDGNPSRGKEEGGWRTLKYM